MTRNKAIAIRIVIYIAILLLPIGMLIGSLNGIHQLNNSKSISIIFDSIRFINDDSSYYLLKDSDGKTYEIETHYQHAFDYDDFLENVENGQELSISYVGTRTLLEVKDATQTYLRLADSTSSLRQTYTFFIILSLLLFTTIAVLEAYEYSKWMKTEDYSKLR